MPGQRVATVAAEFVRLNGNITLTCRSCLIGLDKLDVWIGIVHPNRGHTAFLAGLANP